MLKSILKLFKRKEENGQTYVDHLIKDHKIVLHDTNRRLRVLILGPANAGKTTLLERLTESPAGTAIVTRNGKRVSITCTLAIG
jgi:GTPase SAR1 family protein